jgi:nitrite reductase/ring-hydroxylating ferredoxin subunit
MHDKKYKWYKIADVISELSFGDNNIMQVEAGGKHICLVKISGGISACASKCPHAGGILAEGFLDKDEALVCPVHRYRFNLKNGRDLTGEGYYLKIYPVELNDTGLFVGIPESGLFSWLR